MKERQIKAGKVLMGLLLGIALFSGLVGYGIGSKVSEPVYKGSDCEKCMIS